MVHTRSSSSTSSPAVSGDSASPHAAVGSVLPRHLEGKVDYFLLRVGELDPAFQSTWNRELRQRVGAHLSGSRESAISPTEAATLHQVAQAYLNYVWIHLGHDYYQENSPIGDPKARESFFNRVLRERCLGKRIDEFSLSREGQGTKLPARQITEQVRQFLATIGGADQASAAIPHTVVRRPSDAVRAVVGRRDDGRVSARHSKSSRTEELPKYELKALPGKDLALTVPVPLYLRWLDNLEQICEQRAEELHTVSRLAGAIQDFFQRSLDATSETEGVSGTNLARRVDNLLRSHPDQLLSAYLHRYEGSEAKLNFSVRRKAVIDEFFGWARSAGELSTDWNPRVESLMVPTSAPVGAWYRDYWNWAVERVDRRALEMKRSAGSAVFDCFSERRIVEIGRVVRSFVEFAAAGEAEALSKLSPEQKGDHLLKAILKNPREITKAFLASDFVESSDARECGWGNIHQTFLHWAYERGHSTYNPRVEIYLPPDLVTATHRAVRWWAEELGRNVRWDGESVGAFDSRAAGMKAGYFRDYLRFLVESGDGRALLPDSASRLPVDVDEAIEILLNLAPERSLNEFGEFLRGSGVAARTIDAISMGLRRDFYMAGFRAGVLATDLQRAELQEEFACRVRAPIQRRWIDALYDEYSRDGGSLAGQQFSLRARSVGDFLCDLILESPPSEHDTDHEGLLLQLKEKGEVLIERWLAKLAATSNPISVRINDRPALLGQFLPWVRSGVLPTTGDTGGVVAEIGEGNGPDFEPTARAKWGGAPVVSELTRALRASSAEGGESVAGRSVIGAEERDGEAGRGDESATRLNQLERARADLLRCLLNEFGLSARLVATIAPSQVLVLESSAVLLLSPAGVLRPACLLEGAPFRLLLRYHAARKHFVRESAVETERGSPHPKPYFAKVSSQGAGRIELAAMSASEILDEVHVGE